MPFSSSSWRFRDGPVGFVLVSSVPLIGREGVGTVSQVLALERRAGARGALRGLAGAPPGMPQGSRRLRLCELAAGD